MTNVSADCRFQELCTHLRATDEISFKLLGLVPLVSAAGIAVFLKAETQLSPLIYLVSLFAAIVTLALFCWERRNIQTCLWLRDRAADLEGQAGTGPGHFVHFPRSPLGLGKTEAEKAVYAVTILAWLLLPGLMDVSVEVNRQAIPVPEWIPVAHRVFTWLIGAATVTLVLLPVTAKPARPVESSAEATP